MRSTPTDGRHAPAGDPGALTTGAGVDRADTDGSSPVTPSLLFGSAADGSVGEVRRRPALLLPVALAFVAAALVGVVGVVVRAWTTPTLLNDGVLVHAAESGAAELTSLLLGVVAGVLTVAALGGVVLAAPAVAFDRALRVREVVRELARRWAVLLVGLVGLSLATLVPVALAVLLPMPLAPFVVVPALLAAVLLVAGGGRVAVAALLHGVGLRTAARRVRELRRCDAARTQLGRGRVLVLTVMTGAAALVVAVRWLTADADGLVWTAARDVLQAVVGCIALTVAAAGLTWAHISATSVAERQGVPPLAWRGVARVTGTLARGERGRAAGPGWSAAAGWASAAAAWALVPLLAVAPTLPQVTPALRPQVLALRDFMAAPMTVGTADGVLVLEHVDRGMDTFLCSPEEGCEHGRGMAESGRFQYAAVAADPDGPGVVILAGVLPDDGATARYDLVTCAPTDCTDPDRRTTQVRIAEESASHNPALHAVAARDGAYAAVHPVGGPRDQELALTLCATARCPEPVTVPFGPTSGDDVVDVEIAPDGTVWVLRSQGALVHLARVEPGGTALTGVQVLEPDTEHDSLYYGQGDDYRYSRVLALAVRGDGRPVVLHRDLSDGGIELLGCADAACSTTTSSRLPGGAARGAELVVDGSGRPLAATVDPGVQLHACTDDACSDVRSALLSTWTPPRSSSEFVPFLAIDAQDRPAVLVERQLAEAVVVYCREPHCGL
ncbi:hypothetical protein J1G44_17425 [Cellulomonas sp. zg-ZUI199]|uniref:Uncharacterized protein n=1 Tax=Cellulomonas wangleii TaxID=2816956 RepID=A0ABX8D5R8_9CELL|nr:hypothetical protein [Cellulomonas wangleii]MBO0926258.1 hypothetical protein [Cellulomonas wangleii]QVI62764.1 hypothetical protein KG103_02140 [Cellulomonas wangleii]